MTEYDFIARIHPDYRKIRVKKKRIINKRIWIEINPEFKKHIESVLDFKRINKTFTR